MTCIVVEGCDGAGKTTLIEQAREGQKERYFLTVRASRYPPTVRTALQYLQWIKRQRDLDLILDRIHFISDRIYGPILRNEDIFKTFPLDFGIQDVAAIIHCRPPTETILENCGKNMQLAGVNDNALAIIHGYDELMKTLQQGYNKKIFQYDYTNDDPRSFWRHVWSEVKK